MNLYYSMDETYMDFTSGTHSKGRPKVGFYIVKFFLLFFKILKESTFGFYNLTQPDISLSLF